MKTIYLIEDGGDQDWRQVILTGLLKDEPIFHRCGERPSPPPDNCYWRVREND